MGISLHEFRAELLGGKSQSDLVAEMKHRGLTIIDAIKAVRELYSVSLGDAKQIVSSNPAWVDTASAAVPFHDELIQLFEDLATHQRREDESN